jgi:hypothetical protein
MVSRWLGNSFMVISGANMDFTSSWMAGRHNHRSVQSINPLKGGPEIFVALILMVQPVQAAPLATEGAALHSIKEQEYSPPKGFTTPSGNIACAVFDYDGPPELSCEIAETAWKPASPIEECELDSGKQITMTLQGAARGSWWCAGDTWRHPGIKPLAYGQTWSSQGFSCVSTKANLRCTNAAGRGWEMARGAVRIF